MALQVYEDGLHSCGHPADWAFNDDSEGYFEAMESVCQACAAREMHMRERDGKEHAPGTVVSVLNRMERQTRLRRHQS